MSAGTIWIIMGVIFVVTCGLTGAVRRYALRRGILDVPNARRSHTLPTPRGGGLAVVVVFLTSIIFSALRGIISKELAWAICGGGLLVAGTAALLLAGRKAGLFPVAGATGTAAEAAGIALVGALLVPAAAGFLVWNWPPAKIFMGDVGSGFLGFTFGTLAVASENSGALPLQVWVLLLGVFVVDATATLLRRIRRGERWTEAHRTHAYQLAVQARWTHKQATLAVLGINLLLGLAAAAACLWPRALLLVVGLAGTALVFFWARVVKSCEAHRRSRMEEGIREAAAASSSQPPASF